MLPDPIEKPLMLPGDLLGLIPGKKRSAIYDAIRDGEIPSLRIGSRLYIPTGALRRLWGVDPAQSEGTAPTAVPHATTNPPVTSSESH
ncbi:hypothetical protein BH10ACT8_BH10ACT8_11310 [soil metagenome]